MKDKLQNYELRNSNKFNLRFKVTLIILIAWLEIKNYIKLEYHAIYVICRMYYMHRDIIKTQLNVGEYEINNIKKGYNTKDKICKVTVKKKNH